MRAEPEEGQQFLPAAANVDRGQAMKDAEVPEQLHADRRRRGTDQISLHASFSPGTSECSGRFGYTRHLSTELAVGCKPISARPEVVRQARVHAEVCRGRAAPTMAACSSSSPTAWGAWARSPSASPGRRSCC